MQIPGVLARSRKRLKVPIPESKQPAGKRTDPETLIRIERQGGEGAALHSGARSEYGKDSVGKTGNKSGFRSHPRIALAIHSDT